MHDTSNRLHSFGKCCMLVVFTEQKQLQLSCDIVTYIAISFSEGCSTVCHRVADQQQAVQAGQCCQWLKLVD